MEHIKKIEVEINNHYMRAVMSENQGNKTEAVNEWYLHDCLQLLKEILESGDCNVCGENKTCEHKPKLGALVRFNCPFYEEGGNNGAGRQGKAD